MKLFQKSALAVAIAAVPFLSVNAMEALDDATLSEMTGQAGVTIESTLDSDGITVGSIQYTDVGSVYINDVRVSSSAVGDTYTSTQTIDVDTSGNLITKTKTEGGQNIFVGSVELRSEAQAMKFTTGTGTYENDSIIAGDGSTNASGANLVSNLDVTINQNDASYANVLNLSEKSVAGVAGAVENGAVTVHAIGDDVIGSDGLAIDAGNLTYTAAAYTHEIGGQHVDITKAVTQAGNNIAIVTVGSSHISNLSVDALGGAVSISGLKMHGGRVDGDMTDIKASQVIWAVGEANTFDGSNGAQGLAGIADANSKGGVYIQGSDASSYLEISSVGLGGHNIGSVMVNNIQQKGSVTRIYGH